MSRNDYKKGGTQNPFQTYDKPYQANEQVPYEVFSASAISGKVDQEKRYENSNQMPTAVSLPPHLFIPGDAQSVDIRNLANVDPGTTVTLLTFRGPQGMLTKFINYAVFCDALLFDLINFVPLVNKRRVFPYHGNPDRNYKIGLGLAPDLSNNSLIACQLDLQPNDLVEWQFTNNDTVAVAAGVRMTGYVDQSTIRKTGRFGG